MIPVRNRDCLISRTKGRYRKLMRREFDESLYHERNKTETIFSVIKRRFHSEIKSYEDSMKTKELLYRVLAGNCHRICVISLVLIMISRRPKIVFKVCILLTCIIIIQNFHLIHVKTNNVPTNHQRV